MDALLGTSVLPYFHDFSLWLSLILIMMFPHNNRVSIADLFCFVFDFLVRVWLKTACREHKSSVVAINLSSGIR